MENDLGMYEQHMRDVARRLSKKHGDRATEGKTPVRIDRKTVVYKKQND